MDDRVVERGPFEDDDVVLDGDAARIDVELASNSVTVSGPLSSNGSPFRVIVTVAPAASYRNR